MAWTSFIKTLEPIKLVEALRVCCQESNDWVALRVDRQRERAFGVEASFAADYKGSRFTGQELGLCVSVWPDERERARLTMHATRWENDRSFPSDDEYARAEELATPLFARAGKLLGKRLKLMRPPPDRVRPLRGALQVALRRVTAVYQPTSNPDLQTRALHPNDHERFWRFIRVAHQYQSTLRPADVGFHLAAVGFHPELVAELEREYEIGRQVLAVHDRPWELRRLRKEQKRQRDLQDAAEYQRVFGKPRPTRCANA